MAAMVVLIALTVDNRKEQGLAFGALGLYADRSIILSCSKACLYLHLVLLAELLIHNARFTYLIDAHVLVKRSQLLLRL